MWIKKNTQVGSWLVAVGYWDTTVLWIFMVLQKCFHSNFISCCWSSLSTNLSRNKAFACIKSIEKLLLWLNANFACKIGVQHLYSATTTTTIMITTVKAKPPSLLPTTQQQQQSNSQPTKTMFKWLCVQFYEIPPCL